MDNLEKEIADDLEQESQEKKKSNFDGLAKMSKANLQKQEKSVLIDYCESNNLFKDLTERQKSRLTRKELADLIKPSVKRENKSQEDTNAPELGAEFEKYQTAFICATNGDYSHFDTLAQKNIMSFVSENMNEGGQLSERAQKIIMTIKLIASGGYLIIRFTGGVKKWNERVKNIVTKIKEKVKSKKNV